MKPAGTPRNRLLQPSRRAHLVLLGGILGMMVATSTQPQPERKKVAAMPCANITLTRAGAIPKQRTRLIKGATKLLGGIGGEKVTILRQQS